jgi:TonB family protein
MMKNYGNIAVCLLGLMFFCGKSYGQEGLQTSRYPDGTLQSEIFYIKNVIDGTARWYYENGIIKEEKNFTMGVLNGWLKFYYPNGILKDEISLANGQRDGICKTYYNNGGLKSVRIYEHGKLVKTNEIGYDVTLKAPAVPKMKTLLTEKARAKKKSLTVTAPRKSDSELFGINDTYFYFDLDEKPEPEGGLAAMQKSLYYPPSQKKQKISGEVAVLATVDEYGFVLNTQILKKLSSSCDDAAASAVRTTRFTPGKIKNKSVKSYVIVPVKFVL